MEDRAGLWALASQCWWKKPPEEAGEEQRGGREGGRKGVIRKEEGVGVLRKPHEKSREKYKPLTWLTYPKSELQASHVGGTYQCDHNNTHMQNLFESLAVRNIQTCRDTSSGEWQFCSFFHAFELWRGPKGDYMEVGENKAGRIVNKTKCSLEGSYPFGRVLFLAFQRCANRHAHEQCTGLNTSHWRSDGPGCDHPPVQLGTCDQITLWGDIPWNLFLSSTNFVDMGVERRRLGKDNLTWEAVL